MGAILGHDHYLVFLSKTLTFMNKCFSMCYKPMVVLIVLSNFIIVFWGLDLLNFSLTHAKNESCP